MFNKCSRMLLGDKSRPLSASGLICALRLPSPRSVLQGLRLLWFRLLCPISQLRIPEARPIPHPQSQGEGLPIAPHHRLWPLM